VRLGAGGSRTGMSLIIAEGCVLSGSKPHENPILYALSFWRIQFAAAIYPRSSAFLTVSWVSRVKWISRLRASSSSYTFPGTLIFSLLIVIHIGLCWDTIFNPSLKKRLIQGLIVIRSDEKRSFVYRALLGSLPANGAALCKDFIKRDKKLLECLKKNIQNNVQLGRKKDQISLT
jgi:hypothetical protein